MFRFTLFLLLLAGGGAAAVFKAAKTEPAADDHSPLAEFQRHARQAVEAGRQEAAATEADIMKQYEDAKAGKRA